MLLKPMKIVATSIHNPRTIEGHSPKAMSRPLGICGRQFSVFAKSILDKYTKVLNYQFDYASLVFLEQIAGEGEGERKEYQNNIYVTWKLLYFLLNNESKMNQFLHENPILLKQIVQKVENNLSKIRLEDKTLYQDMNKYYRLYQNRNVISEGKKNPLEEESETGNMTQIQIDKTDSYAASLDYVEQQIELCEKKQQNGALLKKENRQSISFTAPFSMSRSFFVNLNHLIKENKIPNYKQIWQQSVSKQLERYYLDLHMQQFVKEQDLLKQEEMVFQMFQEFGQEEIQDYLEKENETVYQKFLQVMYTLTQSKNDNQELIKNREQSGKKSTNQVLDQNEKSELYRREHTRADEKIKETEYVNTEEYSSMQRELLFAEYKNTEKTIMDILQNSGEITRNIVFSKVEEYKDVFYEYIRTTLDTRNEEQEHVENIQTDNPEVFSDRELKVLLDAVEEKNITEEAAFLQKKLNLIAVKEITESYLKENTELLQKESLQRIQNILEHISFVRESVKTDVDVLQKEKEVVITAHEDLKNMAELKQTEITELIENTRQKEENKNYFSVEHLEQIFETGSLLERKLLYLALEYSMDKMIIEKKHQEEEQIQKELIQAKQNMIQATDMEKRLAGDWRFLMIKQRGKDLLQSVSALGPETRKMLEETVQKNLEAFCYDLEQKQEIETKAVKDKIFHQLENTKKIKTDQILLEEWQSFFDKEDRKQLYHMISESKREHSSKITKEVLDVKEFNKQNQENLSGEKNIVTKSLKISDMIHVLEQGNLPERKLMYLALRNAVSSIENHENKNRKNKKYDHKIHENKNRENNNDGKTENIEKNIGNEISFSKHISQLKEVLFQDTDNIQMEEGTWKFLYQKERNKSLIETLTELKETEKEALEQSIKQEVNHFYKIFKKNKKVKDTTNQKQETENRLVREWKTLLNKEEMIELYQVMEKSNKIKQSETMDKVTNNLQISDMVHIIEQGKLPERKWMYLVLKNAVSSMVKNEKNRENNSGNSTKNQTYQNKQILKLKETAFRDTDNIQIKEGNWKFLNQKERNKSLIKTLTQLGKTDKEHLEESIQQEMNVVHKMFNHSQIVKEKNGKETRRILQNSITKEEREMLLNSEKFVILQSIKEYIANSGEEFTKTFFGEKDTKNMNKKLKIRQLYDKIIHRSNQRSLLNLHDFENTEEKIHQYSKQLNKNMYLSMVDGTEAVNLLIQTNGEFMQPSMEEQTPKVQDKSSQLVLSEKMKSHEESVKLILNHTKERIAIEEKEHQRNDAMEQGEILQKLEGELLDYKVELEDKGSRLEVIEKQLKEQEKQLQLIHESQTTMSNEHVKPEEARQFMRHLKEEMKFEQMRRGKL